MFWLPLIGLALLAAVAAITIKVLIDKAREYLRKKKEDIRKKGIRIVEIKVKDILEKEGKKVVKIGLIGKRKTLIPFRRKVDLGELAVQGDKLEDDIKKDQILEILTPEDI